MCKQLTWRHLCRQGMEWRARCPDEEPGESILWGVSFGFGKRCTYGQEGEGSCDVGGVGAGEFTEPGREQRARTFPADGFKVFSGCPWRLICHKGQMLYFSRRSLSSETPSPCPATTG